MITATNIQKKFDNLNVLKGIDVTIEKGELVAIVGASGAGKTTLIQILGSLMSCDEGSIYINGVDISKLSSNSLADFRNKEIGFVFQFHHLLPEFDAIENVILPALIGGTDRKTATEKATELLNFLGIGNRFNHKPAQLSGGEQQRVAIARALINTPSVILADEPSGNLDSVNRDELNKLLLLLKDKYNQTIVVVTHDSTLADMADRKIVMEDGLIKGEYKKYEE